jgi:hypothetical protein
MKLKNGMMDSQSFENTNKKDIKALLFDEDEEEYTQRELKGNRMDDWDYVGKDEDMRNSSSSTILK